MFYPLLASLVISVDFLLGIVVLSVNPGNIQNRLFFLLMMAFVGWVSLSMMLSVSTDYSLSLLLARLAYIPISFIAPFYLHFILSFSRRLIPLHLYLPAFVFSGISIFTDLLISGLHMSQGNFLYCPGCFDDLIYGPAFGLFAFYFVSMIFYGFWRSFRMLYLLKGIERARMRLLVLGTALPIFIGSVTNVVFPLYGLYGYGIADYLTVIMAVFFFYAFFRVK